MGLLGSIVSLVMIVCAVWVIYDVWAVQKKESTGMRVVWTVLAVALNILTAIIYYILKKR